MGDINPIFGHYGFGHGPPPLIEFTPSPVTRIEFTVSDPETKFPPIRDIRSSVDIRRKK